MAADLEQRALRIIGEVIGLLNHSQFCERLLTTLRDEFAADWCALHELPADLPHTISLTTPAVPADIHATFARLAHQNPLVAHYMTTPSGGAIRFSDLTSREELHALELYQQVYREMGAEYQVAIRLPSTGPRLLGVALTRREHDFTDTECAVLNVVRPYLIECYRNSLAHSYPAEPIDPSCLRDLGLTVRQTQVLAQIAIGRSDQAAANQLGLSRRTVQKHLELGYRILGVTNRSEAAEVVWRHAAAGRTER